MCPLEGTEDTQSIDSRSLRSGKHKVTEKDTEDSGQSTSSEKEELHVKESARSRHSIKDDFIEDDMLPKLSARSKSSSHKLLLNSSRSQSHRDSEGKPKGLPAS